MAGRRGMVAARLLDGFTGKKYRPGRGSDADGWGAPATTGCIFPMYLCVQSAIKSFRSSRSRKEAIIVLKQPLMTQILIQATSVCTAISGGFSGTKFRPSCRTTSWSWWWLVGRG